jgi:NAD(P)-dependent dehydrogenase (short-subunit alcohol dehydrogenase family)
MSKLAGKNILVTGASQGLGREMALRFARESGAGRQRHNEAVVSAFFNHPKFAPTPKK